MIEVWPSGGSGFVRLASPLAVDQGAGRDAELGVDVGKCEFFDENDAGECVVVNGVKTTEPKLSTYCRLHLDDKGCRGAQQHRLAVQLAVGMLEKSVQSIVGRLKLAQRDIRTRVELR